MINITDFSKRFGRENLFEEINLVYHLNKRVTLVGKNGAGKTTFLRCLGGQEDFSGRISMDDLKISMMEQENNFENLDKTFNDYLKEKKSRLEEKRKELEMQMGEPEFCATEEEFGILLDKYNLLLSDSSFDMKETNLIAILEALKMKGSILDQKISELSGGQKIKLRLAECLANKADIYLLDEPTNHLDLETAEWLANYILENIPSLIVVSHDRYFLNEIVDEVWKIEERKIKKYPGKYDKYEIAEAKYLELLRIKFNDNTKRKKKLLESANEKRAWAARAGSRTLKLLADRLQKEAEEIEVGINPEDLIVEMKIHFTNKALHKCEIFRLIDITKKFEDQILFKNITKEIEQGEKIAIIGVNGAGKTTLLKIMTGDEEVSLGELSKRKDLKIGYFDQELNDLERNQTVGEFLKKETGKSQNQLISVLSRFSFEKNFLEQQIHKLSGGEKGRLNLLRITMEEKEVLLLDEPTNNLDVHLKDLLENAIRKFPGTVIIVSHDRHFMDKVATRIWEIKDQNIESFHGNYSQYREYK
jgi:ATP-binding cassette, subfamily F, member 3